MSDAPGQRRRAPPVGQPWPPGDPNLLLRRGSPARRSRSAGSATDSIRRRELREQRSPSVPPRRQADNDAAAVGVSMGTQTSVSVEIQTPPGLLRRGLL